MVRLRIAFATALAFGIAAPCGAAGVHLDKFRVRSGFHVEPLTGDIPSARDRLTPAVRDVGNPFVGDDLAGAIYRIRYAP